MTENKQLDPPLDAGIKDIVEALAEANVETFESCEGGLNHAYLETTLFFHGDKVEGYRAFAATVRQGLSKFVATDLYGQ